MTNTNKAFVCLFPSFDVVLLLLWRLLRGGAITIFFVIDVHKRGGQEWSRYDRALWVIFLLLLSSLPLVPLGKGWRLLPRHSDSDSGDLILKFFFTTCYTNSITCIAASITMHRWWTALWYSTSRGLSSRHITGRFVEPRATTIPLWLTTTIG